MNPPAGTWSQVHIAGHVCDLYDPPRPNPFAQAVIYLHGVHLVPLVGNEAFCREFDKHELRVICPHTGRSWWTDRICPDFDPKLTAERYLLEHVLPYILARWGSGPPLVALLGTSMGGQGALRLAFKHPQTFPVAAALAPAIDYYIRFNEPDEETLPAMYRDAEAARQDSATLHVHPLNWPRHIWFATDPQDDRWHPSAFKLHTKLASLGIPHECDLETSHGGHSWTYYNYMAPRAIDFIAARLERERLRLV